ncbi:MAG TPA: nuclear transport factor 2 family protein [Halioglobus sp.]
MSTGTWQDFAPDTLSRLEQLLDRQDILDCLVRFSRGMDRFDRALFLSAFHPDAIIAAGEFVGGPVALYDWARDLHEQGQSATQHNLLNHSCELDGDVAHTETYYLFVGRNRDETNWLAGGRYIDRLERRGGEWRIALRTTVVEWSGVVPATALPFAEVADLHLNGIAARGREDLSYLRPLINKRKGNVPGLE